MIAVFDLGELRIRVVRIANTVYCRISLVWRDVNRDRVGESTIAEGKFLRLKYWPSFSGVALAFA